MLINEFLIYIFTQLSASKVKNMLGNGKVLILDMLTSSHSK